MTLHDWISDNLSLEKMCQLRTILIKDERVWTKDEKSTVYDLAEHITTIHNQQLPSFEIMIQVYPKDILDCINWIFSNKFHNDVREMPPNPPTNYYYDIYQNLKHEMEQFLVKNDRVISISLYGHRPCYDTIWKIKMLLESEIIEKQIVRRDTETPIKLAQTLMHVNSVEELAALDESSAIYYD